MRFVELRGAVMGLPETVLVYARSPPRGGLVRTGALGNGLFEIRSARLVRLSRLEETRGPALLFFLLNSFFFCDDGEDDAVGLSPFVF
jgi:hypothetical protein